MKVSLIKNGIKIEFNQKEHIFETGKSYSLDYELSSELFGDLKEKIVKKIPVEFDIWITLSNFGTLKIHELKYAGSI